MTVIVGISGKIGAGKDYLGSHIIGELEKRGLTAGNASFAFPLKNELNLIIADLLAVDAPNAGDGYTAIIADLAAKYNIPFKKMWVLVNFIIEELREDPTLHGYARTPGVRSALQYLGTNIRREQDTQYWVNLFRESINRDLDFVIVTDVRFPNEADAIHEDDGFMLRLEVPVEIILAQTEKRDGIKYTIEQLNHDSEIALDDYTRFDLIVGRDFDVEEIVDRLVATQRAAV